MIFQSLYEFRSGLAEVELSSPPTPSAFGLPVLKQRAFSNESEFRTSNATVTEVASGTYNPEMVRTLLRLKGTQPAKAPSGEKEFLDWLNK